MATAFTAKDFLFAIDRATFSVYDQLARERLRKARTVLLAMQEPDRLYFAGLGANLCNAIPAQGMGPVTAFEVLVALGRLMERA